MASSASPHAQSKPQPLTLPFAASGALPEAEGGGGSALYCAEAAAVALQRRRGRAQPRPCSRARGRRCSRAEEPSPQRSRSCCESGGPWWWWCGGRGVIVRVRELLAVTGVRGREWGTFAPTLTIRVGGRARAVARACGAGGRRLP